jgi:beta-1,4-N-acetylglucosaminyltransferase
MGNQGFVVVTDRGGHLHNARMLLEQMRVAPHAILTTFGPEMKALRQGESLVYRIPYVFSWVGKNRWLNPVKSLYAFLHAFVLTVKLRPRQVVSLGASDVVPFCLVARLFGAKIFHVECMNQVTSPSITGRMLYPFCEALYVQWPELLRAYGPKARYSGWVLSEAADQTKGKT